MAANDSGESESMLRHEQKELSKRSRELSVAQSELNSLREGRRTYLKAGEVFFLRPQPMTLQAVTGHLSAIENRRKQVSAQLDQITLSKELNRQMREDAASEEEFDGDDSGAGGPG